MNEELKKYLESERLLNEQLIHNREIAMKAVKWVIISSILLIMGTIIGLIFFV